MFHSFPEKGRLGWVTLLWVPSCVTPSNSLLGEGESRNIQSKSDTMNWAFLSGKCDRKFASVTARASGDISRNIISSARSATLVPMIPDPQPISMIVFGFWFLVLCQRSCLARLTSTSVSSRGINTSGVTTKSRPKKVTFQSIYSMG
jgi:hypothetical protein